MKAKVKVVKKATVKKPKKPMTKAQLAGLAKGRAIGAKKAAATRAANLKKKVTASPDLDYGGCAVTAVTSLLPCQLDLRGLFTAAGGDDQDGVVIEAVLEELRARGLITGYTPVPLDGDLSVSGLVLGVDLPGAHAVATCPGGWQSWGQVWPAAGFPDAVVCEAWAIDYLETRY